MGNKGGHSPSQTPSKQQSAPAETLALVCVCVCACVFARRTYDAGRAEKTREMISCALPPGHTTAIEKGCKKKKKHLQKKSCKVCKEVPFLHHTAASSPSLLPLRFRGAAFSLRSLHSVITLDGIFPPHNRAAQACTSRFLLRGEQQQQQEREAGCVRTFVPLAQN
jgi:hypothetical protein